MKQKKRNNNVKTPCCKNTNLCKVESMVTVDERGQMVLPKELRDKAGIKPNDKLTVITWCKGKKVSCISLMKSDDFMSLVKGKLAPMMKNIFTT